MLGLAQSTIQAECGNYPICPSFVELAKALKGTFMMPYTYISLGTASCLDRMGTAFSVQQQSLEGASSAE